MELLERIAYTESLMVAFYEKSRELSSKDLHIFLDHISEQLANCKVWVANDDHLLYLMAKLRDYEQWLEVARVCQHRQHNSFTDCVRSILDILIIYNLLDSKFHHAKRLTIKNLKDLRTHSDQVKIEQMQKIALDIHSITKGIANAYLAEQLKQLSALAKDPNKL